MLRAVSMGRSQPWRFCLSRRRWMRRLRWANWRRILVFTRNPSLGVEAEKFATYQTPQKAGGFRDFQAFFRITRRGSTLVQGLVLRRQPADAAAAVGVV